MVTPAFYAFRPAQWWLQVEDLEVYEPAVAEEEALPEPEAAPAAKGECGLRTLLFALWLLIPIEEFPSSICVQSTEALQSELASSIICLGCRPPGESTMYAAKGCLSVSESVLYVCKQVAVCLWSKVYCMCAGKGKAAAGKGKAKAATGISTMNVILFMSGIHVC